jgi:hypothetical protein
VKNPNIVGARFIEPFKGAGFINETPTKNHFFTSLLGTFKDIYYTDEENKWLDIVVQNIRRINNSIKRTFGNKATWDRPFEVEGVLVLSYFLLQHSFRCSLTLHCS